MSGSVRQRAVYTSPQAELDEGPDEPLLYGGKKDKENNVSCVLHHLCAFFMFAGVVAIAIVLCVMGVQHKGRLGELELHTHPTCYGAVTKTTPVILNISQDPFIFGDWKEVKTSCMTFGTHYLTASKTGFYEIHGRVTINVNATISEFPFSVFDVYPEVYRLYVLSNEKVVGNYGEGMFWNQNGVTIIEGQGASIRTGSGVHQHLYLMEGDKVTLGLGPSYLAFLQSNFTSLESYKEAIIFLQGDAKIVLDNADLSATYKEPTFPSIGA